MAYSAGDPILDDEYNAISSMQQFKSIRMQPLCRDRVRHQYGLGQSAYSNSFSGRQHVSMPHTGTH